MSTSENKLPVSTGAMCQLMNSPGGIVCISVDVPASFEWVHGLLLVTLFQTEQAPFVEEEVQLSEKLKMATSLFHDYYKHTTVK